MKLLQILNEASKRAFYVSGFPNKKGRYKITAIEEIRPRVFDISLGDNGVTYDVDNTVAKLKFTDNQGKPMAIGAIHEIITNT